MCSGADCIIGDKHLGKVRMAGSDANAHSETFQSLDDMLGLALTSLTPAFTAQALSNTELQSQESRAS